MDARHERRLQKRRRTHYRRLIAVILAVGAATAVLLTVTAFQPGSETPRPAPPHVQKQLAKPAKHAKRKSPRRRSRPPQFVVVSFDGAGGARLWKYWRWVGRRAHAHFTFFVSGVYLLDDNRRTLYRPPQHDAGRSDIWFAKSRAEVRGTLEQLARGRREGHEIGSHFNGHFCAPYDGSVGEWTARDWRRELHQFDSLLFRANENNRLTRPVELPFGREEIVGERTPCLEGKLRTLYSVLAARGFRYDASKSAPLGEWPHRELGLWSVPLAEIPLVGHTYNVLAMDYNFLVNQVAAAESPATIEREVYLTLKRAFSKTYRSNRAPLSYGSHFQTWQRWAYNRALRRFLLETCTLREVRCVSIRELVDWLDKQPPRALRRYRQGRFPVYRG